MALRDEPVYPEDDCRDPDDGEVHLREYWYVVLQRRYTVAVVALSVLMLTGIFTLLQTPGYRATALIYISRGKINLGQDVTIQESITGYEQFSATQQGVLESRTLADRVLDQLDLWQHPLIRVDGGDAGSGAEPRAVRVEQATRLQQMLRVSPVANTQLFEVTYTTPDGELSARLANALAEQYISYSTEAESGVAKNTSAFIRGQIKKLQQEIESNERLLQDYSEREDIVMIDEKENIVVQKLEEVNRELTRVQADRAAAEARYQTLKGQDVESYPEILRNEAIQNLKRQRADLQRKQAELSARFKPNYPELKLTTGALADVERRLELETRDVARKVLAGARVEYETARSREAILFHTLELQRRDARALNGVASEYARIKVALDNQREMLEQLLRRESETALSSELSERQSVTARLVDEAVVPSSRHTPNYPLNLSVGGIVGLVLGLGFAFFLHYWDTSIYNVDDIRRYCSSLALLGVVPHEPALPVNGREGGYVPVSRPSAASARGSAAIAERLKFVRTSILLSSPESPPRTVLVTSSTEGEGKTFVACHLAACFAELGKNVLLMDADLRKPTLQKVFRRNRNLAGLSTVLTGHEESQQACIQGTSLANLSLVLAGPRSPSPAELLGSSAMEKLLRWCGERFDVVIVDSAPLLPVVDSHALVGLTDAVLLVVRSGRTSRHAVRASEELVRSEHGRITGLLLNDVDFDDYAQSYFYSYSHEYVKYSDEGDGEGVELSPNA